MQRASTLPIRIKPHFRSNDYEGGLETGIDSILKAIRGEYKGQRNNCYRTTR